jgi:hypothetical protein
VVAKDVAGTNDHEKPGRPLGDAALSILKVVDRCKKKKPLLK